MFRNNHLNNKSQLVGDKKKEKRPGGGEPEYEEVGPPRSKVENNDRDSVRPCELCGSAEAAVRCEKCNSQAFCFSCDDMYHRHPKRSTHSRKALHSLAKDEKTVRPPLPPKDGQLISPPQPPPRRHKRPAFLSSGTANKKEVNDESGKSLMGSLRRFMGTRPLPAPPDQSNGDCKGNNTHMSSVGSLTRSKTAPTALSESNLFNQSLTVAIPQSIMDLNRKGVPKPAASMPPTPISAHSQYPPLQPKIPLPSRDRKLSLQQFPPSFDAKRASMMEVPPMTQTWGNQPTGMGVSGKGRSQSVSNEQWNQLIDARGGGAPASGHCGNNSNTDLAAIPPHHPGFISTLGRGRNGGRGMVTSASVCDLNTLAQQQQRSYPNMPSANSFQQLSLMSYDGGNMMWVPSCALCQPPPMYPQSMGSGGMKRTTSNISMNMSSVGSDITGYPWAGNPHVHHMPPMYPPGYYPGCHQHMMPHMQMQGSAMSIPDSTRSFNRMPPSPAPSVRSNSHRSHKSSKARSYCGGDTSGRKSRNRSRRRSEESDDSRSSSLSENEQVQIPVSRTPVKTGLAWQCDHCTFINPGHVHSCGMCSKTLVKNTESHSRRGSDRRKNGNKRDRKTDQDENISDYDNDKGTRKRNGRESKNEHRQKGSGSLKGSGRPRNKSRQRDSLSRSPSLSGSNEDEGAQLERQLKDLRIASRSRPGDYERLSMTSRAKEPGSLKREGGSRYKNRRRFNSERSRTPARSSPSRRSGRTSINSDEENSSLNLSPLPDNIPVEQKSSHEGTLIGAGTASDSRTLKAAKSPDVKIYSKYLGKAAESSESNSESESPEEIPPEENNEEDLEVFDRKSDSPKVAVFSKDQKIYAKEVRANIGKKEENKIYEIPSFANTLDGIETLKTNELADVDPNSQAIEDRPSSTEVHLPDLDDIIPVLNYNPPIEDSLVYEMRKEEQSDQENDKKTVKEKEKILKNLEKRDASSNVFRYTAKPKFKVEEPSYEIMEPENGKSGNGNQDILFAKENILGRSDENVQVASSSQGDERNVDELIISSSSESLNDLHHGQRFTPLSFSSSEALFYSPPDSPDLTVSEKLRRRTNQAAPQTDDDLVTALETINSSERDVKSSRETIRSSVEQLPYSEEDLQKFEDAEGSRRHSIEKSSSATSSPLTAEGRVAENSLSNFKNPIQLISEPRQLKRSISEQMLSFNAQQKSNPRQKEVRMNPSSMKGNFNRAPSLVMTEDEDEIDEKYLTVKELIARRKQKTMKKQGLELVQLLRDAEDHGYNPEEVSVALSLSGDKGPIEWLEENWGHMVNTVKALASNYGQEKNVNDIGKITPVEAKKALRAHKGNIWAAVTECVEERRKKFNEIYNKGKFQREEIIKALEAQDGDAEVAYVELCKTKQVGSSFFKKIWAPAEGAMQSVSTLFRRDSKSTIITPTEESQSPSDNSIPQKSAKDFYLDSSAAGTENLAANQNEYANLNDQEFQNETGGGIYANVVTPLLRKIEETLQKSNAKIPALSEDLKRKIVKAIIEGDPEAPDATFNFDSDDESTIEELLAVAENPTFYEYFTAVDLEDDYEDESSEEDVEDEEDVGSSNESSFNETQDNLSDQEDELLAGAEVTSEFEYQEEQKYAVKEAALISPQNEVVAVPVQKDVVVPPAQSLETNISKLKKIKIEKKNLLQAETPLLPIKSDMTLTAKSRQNALIASLPVVSPVNLENLAAPTTSKKTSLKEPLSDKSKKTKMKSKNELGKNMKESLTTVQMKAKTDPLQNKDKEVQEKVEEVEEEREKSVSRSFEEAVGPLHKEEDEGIFTKEENPESGEEEESMSITTGRLSLSVRQTGDKKANIDVKSQTIQTDIVAVQHQTEESVSSATTKSLGATNDSTLSSTLESTESDSLENDEILPERAKETAEANDLRNFPTIELLDPEEAAKVRAHGGPVTVQKATQIVGKAIAKAMARESSVRRDSYSSDSSSQMEIPTPPPSTPDPEEQLGKLETIETSESEDELLRSLDTIPEEADSGSQVASKSLSIPPAVASFSGPIFIPNLPAADNPGASSTHSYYNVPKKTPTTGVTVGKEQQTLNKSISADYDSVSQEAEESVVKVAFNATATDLVLPKPSTNVGPLIKEEAKDKRVNEPNDELSNKKTTVSKDNVNAKPESIESIPSKLSPNLPKGKIAKNTVIPSQIISSNEQSSSEDKISKKEESRSKPPLNKTPAGIKTKKVPHEKATKISKTEEKSSPETIKENPTERPENTKTSEASTTSLSPSFIKRSPVSSPSKRLQQVKRRSTIDSSGESEDDEELAAAAQRVNLINQPKQVPQALLLKVEDGLKRGQRRNTDYDDPKPKESDMESEIELKPLDSEAKEAFLEHPVPQVVVIHPQTDDEEEEKSVTVTDYEKDHEYEQLRFDRTVRRLLAEGQATSYEKAELAAHLLTFSFDETDSIQAAEGCSSLYSALQFLQQDCELCASKFPMGRMVSMLHCIHRCCYDCANNYFSFQIKTKNIRELRCPFCNEPDLETNEESATEYLNNMDILLKNILDEETHELFQRKLRDWTLMKDPNFKWCNKCSSGFIANPRARKLICPDCMDVTCAHCRKQWELQHEGITCEDYTKWLDENDPEKQAEGVDKHLAECGITCPNCRFTYALAKGGCMHFTCTECKYEFCSGCNKPFKQGAKCTVGPYCERLGLHAHHPRNCLFYLRDKEPGQLQQLLKEYNIYFNVDSSNDAAFGSGRCSVQEQKETLEGLRDEICGRATLEGNAGLCRLHYIEYLVELINNHGLDPVSIFDEADLRVCLRRNGKSVPVRRWESEKLYRDKLIKLIKEQLPLC